MRFLAFALALAIGAGGCLGAVGPGGSGGGGSGGGGSGGGAGGGGGTGGTVADAHQQHCVDQLNMYRAQAGVAPLQFDAQLSTFSMTASMDLAATGQPHAYFQQEGQSGAIWNDGFCNSAAENQAPGWDASGGVDATVDSILQAMMAEGPGGGHHDNILAPSSSRVGVGLYVDAQQRLWFTNDFSASCN